MPDRCVVGHCSNERTDGKSLFHAPIDEGVRKKWDKFILQTRSDFIACGNSTLVCQDHFVESDFINWRRHVLQSVKLRLDDFAFPSVMPKKKSPKKI